MKKVSVNKAIEKFLPENIVFVLSYDRKNNRSSGMIASSCMVCSYEPYYMLVIALWKKGYTHKLIQDTKEFVIAVPNKSLEKAVDIFGMKHGDKVNKVKLSNVTTSKAKFLQTSLLADATINFECKVEKEVDVGDHILFIGKIVASYINEDKKVLLNFGIKKGKRVSIEF
ncbi:MAG: flavin reductase family protein [Atribacterota bacterium]|nr:flavin reductase family protein [Atribacterota bacterium]